ncbi:MAG TPA: hypothetical protein PK299_05160 [Anaerolineales bacterium]|nr:hypothetical protein [Anaerolineales bacterium]
MRNRQIAIRSNPFLLVSSVVFVLGLCLVLGIAFGAVGLQWRQRQSGADVLDAELTQRIQNTLIAESAFQTETALVLAPLANVTPTAIAGIAGVAPTQLAQEPSPTSFTPFPTAPPELLLNTPQFVLPSATGITAAVANATNGSATAVLANPGNLPTLDPNAQGSPTINVPAFLAQTATAAAGGGATRTPLPTLRPIVTPGTSAPTALIPRTADPNATATQTQSTASPTVTETPSLTALPATATSRYEMGAPAGSGSAPAWSIKVVFTPEPASGSSKLGLHVRQPSGVVEFAESYKPAVVVAVSDVGFLKDVKARSPQTITVGRFPVSQPMGEGDAEQAARDFVNGQLGAYQANAGYVDYWQGYNEPPTNQMDWYARFEATRACEMQAKGFKAAIGGFGPGRPEMDEFEKFMPAIEAGIRCGAVLLLHESAGPNLWLWYSQGLPNKPWYPDRGALMGRYRYFYRDILIPRDKVIPLILDEVTVNGAIGAGLRAGPSNGGWHDLANYWISESVTSDPQQYYLDQLIWYDSLLRRDSYVLGAAVGDCCAQQTSYDLAELLGKLGQYLRSSGR